MKPSTFPHVAVVGMHFRGEHAKAIVGNLVPPAGLVLAREPDNEYDSYAIKALWLGEDEVPIHIGYIERGQAAFIAPWMDDGWEFSCTVERLELRRNNLHPICTIRPIHADQA